MPGDIYAVIRELSHDERFSNCRLWVHAGEGVGSRRDWEITVHFPWKGDSRLDVVNNLQQFAAANQLKIELTGSAVKLTLTD